MGVKSSVQESNTEVLARSQTLIVDQESRCFPLMSTVLIFFSLLSRRFVFDPTQVGKEGSCIRYSKTIVKMQTNCLSSDLQM